MLRYVRIQLKCSSRAVLFNDYEQDGNFISSRVRDWGYWVSDYASIVEAAAIAC